MQQLAGSELNAALASARETRRLQRLLQHDEELKHREIILDNRRARGELLASPLARAGFDRAGYETVRERHLSQLHRLAGDVRASGATDAEAASETQRFAIDVQRRGFELAAIRPLQPPIAPGQPYPFYIDLDTPQSVTATSGLALTVYTTAAWNSLAKFTFDKTNGGGNEELTFTFLWQNPNDTYTVLNADGYMVFRGYCQADANGEFWGGGTSDLSISAVLEPWQLWDNPPTLPPADVNQTELVLDPSLHADGSYGSPPFGLGDIEWRKVYRGYDLRYDTLTVPPGGMVAFDLVMSISYSSSDGHVQLDFNTGNYMVMGVGVLVAIVS